MASSSILVVDDEVGIRELLSDILQDEGYSVRVAENAQAARDERQKERPSLVLLDIWMPDSDGISVLKEWANAGLLTMPVVMMSGHGTIDTAVEATRIGAFDYLEKPIALQKLLKTVEEGLKHGESMPSTEMNLTNFGKSSVIQELKERLEQVSSSKNSLLLVGKKGGSVELCAQSLRKPDANWLSLNEYGKLATAPLELLEQVSEGILYIEEVTDLNATEQKGLRLAIGKAEKYGVRVISASVHGIPYMIENGLLEQGLLQTSVEDVERVLSQFQTSSDFSHMLESFPIDLTQPLRASRDDFERYYFTYHMKLVNNNMSKLAEISGLERTHLYRKLKQLGISIKSKAKA